MSEYNYTGNKTKNSFTAYLQIFVRRKRRDYINKKQLILDMEKSLKENIHSTCETSLEEMLETKEKEKILLKECKGAYISWNELSNQKLADSLRMLHDQEKIIIYQHIFEERTFKEIALINGLTNERVKGIYYYSIRKMRKWMGDENYGF